MATIAKQILKRLSRHPEGRDGSKLVTDRLKAADALLGSIRTHKDKVVARLHERQAPFLRPGETLPDYAFSIELAGREVQAAMKPLREADLGVRLAVTGHFTAQRARRKWARKEVYPRVRDLRRRIELLLGREVGRCIHGLQGRTRRKLDSLEAQARILVGLLRTRSGEEFTRVDGGTIDPEVWLPEIQPAYQKLEELGEAINLRYAEASEARQEKELAIEAFDVTYHRSLVFLSSVYTQAGLRNSTVRRLRSYHERRRLSRWAAYRREARAKGEPGAAPHPRREGPARVAVFSAWLRARWKAGGRRATGPPS